MNNTKLAEKIVKVVVNETTHIDMMEGVVDLLDKYRPTIKNIKQDEWNKEDVTN